MLHKVEIDELTFSYEESIRYMFSDYGDIVDLLVLWYNLESDWNMRAVFESNIYDLNSKISDWISEEEELSIISSIRSSNKKMIDQMYSKLILLEAKEKEWNESWYDENEAKIVIENLFSI